jgi:hypothetical protein
LEKPKGTICGGRMTVPRLFVELNGASEKRKREKYKYFDNGWRKTNTHCMKFTVSGKSFSESDKNHYGAITFFCKYF